MHSVEPDQSEHWYEIDVIKAVSILVVVLIHSVSTTFQKPDNFIQEILSDWTRFAVPCFFLVSGFLFDKTKYSTGELLAKWGKRMLGPYLFCSCLMIGLQYFVTGLDHNIREMRWDEIVGLFVWGDALGVYYFVFVLSYLHFFSYWLRHWHRTFFYLLLGVEAIATVDFFMRGFTFWMIEGKDNFWMLFFRHPVFHLLPYLVGWAFSLHYTILRPWLKRHALSLIVSAVIFDIMVMISLSYFSDTTRQLLIQIHVYLSFIIVLCTGIRFKIGSCFVQFLSGSSYGIYLLHVPFVYASRYCFEKLWNFPSISVIFISWLSGSAMTILMIMGIKRCLKERAFYLIGS